MPFNPDPMPMEAVQAGGEVIITGNSVYSNQALSPTPWSVSLVWWPAGRRPFDKDFWVVTDVEDVGTKRQGTFVLSSQAESQINVLSNGGQLYIKVRFNDGTYSWLRAAKGSQPLPLP